MNKFKAFRNGYVNEATDEWRYVEPLPSPEENDDEWGFVLDQLKPKPKLNDRSKDNDFNFLD